MAAYGFRKTELQIKAPRVVSPEGAVHRKVGYESWFIKEPEKNNELKRTETNSGSVSSYGVRKSSLLIFFIFGGIYRQAQPHFGTRIAETIHSLSPETDISEVMGSVENLLDESIATEGYVIGKALMNISLWI